MQRTVGDRGAETEAGGGRGGGERAVRTGVAGEEVAERVLHRFGERLRDADRERRAQCVAQPSGVLDRRPVLAAADPDPDGPAGR